MSAIETTPADGTVVGLTVETVIGETTNIAVTDNFPFQPDVVISLARDEEGHLVSAVATDGDSDWTQRDLTEALSILFTDALEGSLYGE